MSLSQGFLILYSHGRGNPYLWPNFLSLIYTLLYARNSQSTSRTRIKVVVRAIFSVRYGCMTECKLSIQCLLRTHTLSTAIGYFVLLVNVSCADCRHFVNRCRLTCSSRFWSRIDRLISFSNYNRCYLSRLLPVIDCYMKEKPFFLSVCLLHKATLFL